MYPVTAGCIQVAHTDPSHKLRIVHCRGCLWLRCWHCRAAWVRVLIQGVANVCAHRVERAVGGSGERHLQPPWPRPLRLKIGLTTTSRTDNYIGKSQSNRPPKRTPTAAAPKLSRLNQASSPAPCRASDAQRRCGGQPSSSALG
jgi:hypothetical protein